MSTPPKLTSVGSSRDDIPTIGPRPTPFDRAPWRARDEESASMSAKDDADPVQSHDDEPDIKEMLAPRAARTTVYIVGGVLGGVCALVLISLLVNSIMDFKLTNSETKQPPASQASQSAPPSEAKPAAPRTDQDYAAAQKKLADALSRMNARQQPSAAKPAEAAAPAPSDQASPAAAPSGDTAGSAPPPAPAPAEQAAKAETRPPPPTISADDVSRALVRASSLIREGQVASARALLERAALSNDPSAAFALAETYDPKALARWKTIGIAGDPARARALYKAALDGGVAEARARLDDMDR